MGHTRTVTLELLRHGPAHNQLLSPLTQYLALCGNHPATTVSVPFEHNHLLVRLKALMYRDSEGTRSLQLKDTARIMAEVLGKVPGLIAELAEPADRIEPALTHLRLILSASELALLPFELADAPNGFPGAGQPLALQAQAPLCVTREVRRVSYVRYPWPTRPRVLFLAASPPDVGLIPLEAHLLALRRVVDPWVEAPGDPTRLADQLSDDLVVQTQASVASIRKACAEGDFTHVHILAHGVPLRGEQETRYGLALHQDRDPDATDVVDGARLATLLRTYRRQGGPALSGPAVVTLAACDSGNTGSVVGAGASIAHALHEGGIPLVIASQFPLSFAASVILAEVIYDGLLWGNDPRALLNDLRWQLKSLVPETHDWASLVAYASLPVDLETQLSRVRFEQAHRCINTVLKSMDRVTSRMKTKKTPAGRDAPPAPESEEDRAAAMGRARRKIDDAKGRLYDLLRSTARAGPGERALIYGLLASTEKRDAELLYRSSLPDNKRPGKGVTGSEFELMVEALRRARGHYADAFRVDRSSDWALTEELCVSALLATLEGGSRGSSSPLIPRDAWETARYLAEADLDRGDPIRVCWAHGSLIELWMLNALTTGLGRPNDASTNRARALEHAERLARVGGHDSIEVYSTRRQVARFTNWFNEISTEFESLEGLAHEVLDRLPFNPRFA